MDWLVEIFRQNPVIPIFLTLGLGFWLGGLRYKSFSLGPVIATLIVGVVIGQLGIPISDTVLEKWDSNCSSLAWLVPRYL